MDDVREWLHGYEAEVVAKIVALNEAAPPDAATAVNASPSVGVWYTLAITALLVPGNPRTQTVDRTYAKS